MGGRWLEVYKASRTELFRATGSVAALRPDASFEGVVVASGLPFRLSPSNLVDFFKGYEVVRNGVYVLACSTLVRRHRSACLPWRGATGATGSSLTTRVGDQAAMRTLCSATLMTLRPPCARWYVVHGLSGKWRACLLPRAHATCTTASRCRTASRWTAAPSTCAS